MSNFFDLTASSDDDKGVSDSTLTARIRSLVRSRDCSKLTPAKVQKLLEKEFKTKLGDRKDLIARRFRQALKDRTPVKKTPADRRPSKSAPVVDLSDLLDLSKPRPSPHTQGRAGAGAGAGIGSASGKAEGASAGQQDSLSIVFPPKKKAASTLLLQFGSDKFDIRGSGTVGKLSVGAAGMVLDLKGHRYAGTLVPCNTFMLVGVSGNEAKVEAVMNEHVQVTHVRDVVSTLGGVFMQDGELAPLLEFDDLAAGGTNADAGAGGGAEAGKSGHKTKARRTKKTRTIKMANSRLDDIRDGDEEFGAPSPPVAKKRRKR